MLLFFAPYIEENNMCYLICVIARLEIHARNAEMSFIMDHEHAFNVMLPLLRQKACRMSNVPQTQSYETGGFEKQEKSAKTVKAMCWPVHCGFWLSYRLSFLLSLWF